MGGSLFQSNVLFVFAWDLATVRFIGVSARREVTVFTIELS